MPKFTYSASKGIEQTSGSGFFVENVPISRSVANSGTALVASAIDNTTLGSEETYYITLDNAASVTFSTGGAVGEQKVVVIGTQTATPTLTITNGDNMANPGSNSVTLFVWNGSAWKKLA